MSTKFAGNQAKINDTSYSKSQLGQNERRNICELSLMIPRKNFDISEEDLTQTIYENYLGIFRVPVYGKSL